MEKTNIVQGEYNAKEMSRLLLDAKGDQRTAAAFCDICGISVSTFSRYANGLKKRSCPVEILEKIAIIEIKTMSVKLQIYDVVRNKYFALSKTIDMPINLTKRWFVSPNKIIARSTDKMVLDLSIETTLLTSPIDNALK